LNEFEVRPWGSFEVLDSGSKFKVKRIIVNPAGCLSLQSHARREECWVVVSGCGEFQLGEIWSNVAEGQVLRIKIDEKHRIKNTGSIPLVFIEVQMGDYFGEDDIVRYDDVYGRVV